ncbi:MAG: electron transfer flavoprotein subunit alpha/FixB family protein [Thermoproteota archaeon]
MRILAAADGARYLADLAGFAKSLGEAKAVAVVLGPREEAEKRAYDVFEKVVVVPPEAHLDGLYQALSKLYEEQSPDMVVGVSTKNSNTVLARLAAARGIPMYTEAVEVSVEGGTATVRRQVMGGKAFAVYKASLPIAATVPKGKFSYDGAVDAPIEELQALQPRVKVVSVEEKAVGGIDLESAEIVVGVGRGFRSKEDLALAEELAKLLGGVVGATRPIVADYGWLGEDRWIGISGKKIKPKVYIAIGISGAPQHMAAAMDSKIIVAINKDKNAPVFEYADYGVVADLYKFLPTLIEKLKSSR